MTALAAARPPNQLQIQSASPAQTTTRMPDWITVESWERKERESVGGRGDLVRVTGRERGGRAYRRLWKRTSRRVRRDIRYRWLWHRLHW